MKNKIAFIICTNNKLYCDECLHYISNIEIPNGFEIETILIENAEYITKAYNEAINQSQAKYKVYLHQDTFIINKKFIYNILEIFEDKSIGMIGMVGCKKLPESDKFLDGGLWDVGRVYACDGQITDSYYYGKTSKSFVDVQAVDGMLMITQYDIPWREDIFCGWDFYDISQSMEFLKNKYRIVVPDSGEPWSLHAHGILNYDNYDYWKQIFFDEYSYFIKKMNIIELEKTELFDTNNSHETNIFKIRTKIVDAFKDTAYVTIGIVAYNRLEVTKLCVKSVLENTKDVNYKLVLVYNENEQGKGILEFFNSIDYKNKVVIHIPQNIGAPFAYQQIQKHIEGKYFIHLPNDVIVTSNWLSNLIKCAESDDRIGMVNPVSSNVSNLQCVDLIFDSYEEMQQKAAEYNVSDPLKWQERMRLVTLGTLFTRECLLTIGNIFDCGFIHDFGDDDVSFRVRRAGYKLILAVDTWVHHDHDLNSADGQKPYNLNNSIEIGKNNFSEKYYGIDAWNDVNNFVFPYIEKSIGSPNNIQKVNILGIDTKCGTPLLDIKNLVKKYGVSEIDMYAFTTESKYDIDLKTICNRDVVCNRIDFVYNSFVAGSFDYIIIGNDINGYSKPEAVIRDAYALLKSGGEMFVSLKNTYNIFTFLKLIGYELPYNETSQHCSLEDFCINIKNMGINVSFINQKYLYTEQIVFDFVTNVVKQFKPENANETDICNKMQVEKYWLKIIKQL